MQAPPTGVEVNLKYFPLAFLYGMFPVYAIINGTEMRSVWGAQFYPLPPGRHQIGAYTKYMLTPRAGLNYVEVDVQPGQVVRVTWTAPHVVFMKGPITSELIASAYGPGMPAPAAQPLSVAPPPALQPIPPPAPPMTCPRCGTLAQFGAFCERCGQQLRT